MPTPRETILTALHARLLTLPATVLRGEVLPERVPADGLLILRDGEPGEPEVTLSPLRYHYQHRAEIEAVVQGANRDAAFDTLCAGIGTALIADRTLGGLCDWVEAEAPRPVDLAVEGAASLKAAVIPVVLHYSTADPLGWPRQPKETPMARAQGARAQMALAFETVYGTPPANGFTKMPFASTSLGAEQPLLNSELLGYGRDPLAPIKDAVTADGDVVVPIDAEAFGFWLKAAFGDPTTTGTGPWTHEFRSGAWTLPSMSIETGMPEVPRFAMYSGYVLDQLSWQVQRLGLLTATARLVAQGETVGATTSAGTPAALELKRFGHFNGSITRNGTALGNVVSADITYANNLDRIETIRADGRIDGADSSIAALTGSIEVRFADQTLVTQAINGEACKISFAYSPSWKQYHHCWQVYSPARNAPRS